MRHDSAFRDGRAVIPSFDLHLQAAGSGHSLGLDRGEAEQLRNFYFSPVNRNPHQRQQCEFEECFHSGGSSIIFAVTQRGFPLFRTIYIP